MRGQRQLDVGVALLIEEHIARGAAKRHFTEVDRGGAARGGTQHKATAAEIACLRMRDRQRKANGNGGIHRVAALAQDIHAHPGRRR